MVLVLQLLILCWSQPMWSTLVFVHEHSISVQGIQDMLLLVISAALQRLKNAILAILWRLWTNIIQVTVVLVFHFAVLTETPCYAHRTAQQKAARRAWKWLFTSCDAMCTWIDSKIKLESRANRAVNQHRSRNKRALKAMTVLAMRASAHTERQTRFDTDSDIVGVDNRCSGCISHVKEDFIGELKPCNRAIKGFGGTRTMNVSTGTLRWSWEDDHGQVHTFDIPNSYYVPDGHVRLLSPQHWAQSYTNSRKRRKDRGEHTNGNECVLYWQGGKHNRHIQLGQKDNVATFTLAPGYTQFEAFCCEADMVDPHQDPVALPSGIISDDEDDDHDVVEARAPSRWQSLWERPMGSTGQRESVPATSTQVDFNLNGPTTTASEGEISEPAPNVIIDEEDRQPKSDMAEMLMLHHQYGHISMRKIQEMAKQGILPKRLSKCRVPTCSACLYSKATRRPWRGKTTKSDVDDNKPTRPGQVVSVDQLVSPTPGLIAQMSGFLTTKRYRYATVYVDQYSRLGFIYLQKTASGLETVEGKKAFESMARRHGIRVENYHADNGIFKAHEWTEACKKEGQGLTFAGVNAHHQNGVAERRIKELQEMARTMLIHANKRWPDSVTVNLWPYALRTANEALNNTPSLQDEDRRSPMEIFTKSKVVCNPKHWKPFGCPVYVLDNALQARSPFHKWKQRSRVGVYLGMSPLHGRNVALVLDRDSGHVSPQFHVALDAAFDTIKQITTKSNWQNKAGFVAQREATNAKKRPAPIERHVRFQPTGAPSVPIRTPEGGTMAASRKRKLRTSASQAGTPESREGTPREPAAATVGGDGLPTSQGDASGSTTGITGTEVKRTRSGRKTKPASRLIEAMVAEIGTLTSTDVKGEIFCYQAMYPDDRYEYDDPLLIYKAVSDPDTLYYHEAMKDPDRVKFQESMLKEVTDQFENGNFTVVHKSRVPEGQVVLPAVWQMKRKRDVMTGAIKKYKARLNIDGSRMRHGVHYNETYSPVASWNSVRMLLTLTAVHGWHTKQIDYVQAFAQAPVEKTLYMKIPAGVELEDGANTKEYVLQIHRNIYGQKQAGRVWNKYLVNKLVKELGFKQSKVDECVFYRGKTLYVLYTDDSLLAGPDLKEIEQVIYDLQHMAKLAITVEGDLADFLGVNIDRRDDGTIHLSQPHLIDQILEDLRLKDDTVKIRTTPAASSKLLTRHSDSQSFDNSFNYRSVIGKLNYLEKATRSDISYAVHQCARFVSNPKVEHGEAVRWLGRYLKATRDKGTIMRPIPGKDLEVFVDASFCGDWDPKEAALDRDTARSRHGYIIKYAGCPLLWKSQLQTEIALSTTESEYTGLSYALRDAIPVMELLKEMKSYVYPIVTSQARVHCRVFEDNSGALEMAKVHKYRPRTKHMNVKLHHFRDYVERQEITIHPIGTSEQPADFLTKALNEELLLIHRMNVLGW